MTNINKFTELDFDEIRESIVNHLKTKTEFQDFQFEGPAISLLVDALAYTATYTAVHANMAVTETFIDSAQLRNSIVSKAKELNYIPRSVQAPFIEFELVFEHPNRLPEDGSEGLAENLIIPIGTEFTVTIQTNTFTFVTVETFNFKEEFDSNGIGGIYRAPIRIYEGQFKEAKFTIPSTPDSKVRTRYRIPTQQVDTRFLTVSTEKEGEIVNWQPIDNVVNLKATSPAYFLQEGLDGVYEIYFGDGIIGRLPDSNANLTIRYLTTSGVDANGLNGDVSLASLDKLAEANVLFDPTITPTDPAITIDDHFDHQQVTSSREGANRETDASIQLAAPRAFQSQNRTVTRDDYVAVIQNRYGFIKTMSVWGGEDNDPPRFGSTFIAVKPKIGSKLTPITKEKIKQDLVDNFSIVSITPEIVDPDIIFVFLDVTANFRLEEAGVSAGQIVKDIQTNITNFFESNITFFNRTLRQSKLLRVVDDSNLSIQGSSIKTTLAKKFSPDNQRAVEVVLNFYNELIPGTVKSREFKNSSGNVLQLRDDGKGKMNLIVNGRTSLINIATINYLDGKVQINGLRNTETRRFIFRVDEGVQIIIEAKPKNFDLKTTRSGILELDPKELDIGTNQIDEESD